MLKILKVASRGIEVEFAACKPLKEKNNGGNLVSTNKYRGRSLKKETT